MILPVIDENNNSIGEIDFSIASGTMPEEMQAYVSKMPLTINGKIWYIKSLHFIPPSSIPSHIEVYNAKET